MSRRFYSGASHVGLVRTNNEDTLLCSEALALFGVADGMGGHEAGEVASALAVETVQAAMQAGATLAEAVQQAHKSIVAAANEGRGHWGMGTTLVALHSEGASYRVAWVGDSRAYLWSKQHHQRSFEALTIDHSFVQKLYQQGLISAAEMTTHPRKNVITQCLGSMDLAEVTVDEVIRTWQADDWVLLCSDGLNDAVSDQGICDILSECDCPEQAVQRLIQAALDNGGRDNISVVVVSQPPRGFWRRLAFWRLN